MNEVAAPSQVFDVVIRTDPDVVVLSLEVDIEHPNLLSRLISESDVAVILIAVTAGGSAVWRGMAAGVSGYLLKDRLGSELRLALDSAEAGGTFVSPPLVRQLIGYLGDRFGRRPDGRTTAEINRRLLPRERETLYRLAAGQSTEEIAEEMSVASATVRAYVSRMLRKLELRSRGEAIALAYRSGYYSPGSESDRPPVSDDLPDVDPAAVSLV
ncbi:LuxR C-terminal-related transcriptional regulator [Actinomadura roseirufa]|uniref:LuxR C-terminal-related transcriptional regulator n=1 Tax=Actinomadura roseirufa TaxID=2094049 RepID=UPI0013F153C2|nr:response regulator transcription factor [Actinomadura roseirufa]